MLYLAVVLLFQSRVHLFLFYRLMILKFIAHIVPYICVHGLCFVLKQIMFREFVKPCFAAVQLFATFVAEQFSCAYIHTGLWWRVVFCTSALTGAANGERTLMHFTENCYC